MTEKKHPTILIAPLDWGLGHATRCIPIIKYLHQLNCKIIIASEGQPEKVLKTEFPSLTFVHLPGYNIQYTNNQRLFVLKIILQLPKILRAIKSENKWLINFLLKNEVDAVISDNRYGFYSTTIPAVFITHQLQIKAPLKFVEKMVKRINYHLIEKFSHCWVPDLQGHANLAGQLSHPHKLPTVPVSYIGALSRFEKQETSQWKYKVLIVISGPEPQRTLLEHTILKELKNYPEKVLLVRGLPGTTEKPDSFNQVTIANHLTASELSTAFNESEFIVSRSGYTTVMDIIKLQKKAILIPTPGQTEQQYLASHLQNQRWCMAASQHNFSLVEVLQKAANFNFAIPALPMEEYRAIVANFVAGIKN